MRVGFFATCPVDLLRPSVAFASIKLLRQAGCQVSVPAQSCCGQLAYNNGERDAAKKLAWCVVKDFCAFDYTVLPSGSCTGMIKHHYPKLFDGDVRLPEVQRFCDGVFELNAFLVDVLNYRPAAPNLDASAIKICYHDSCAGLRELGIKSQPRQLLAQCARVELLEMQDTQVCCGFGGTFCVKFPQISNKMACDKLANAREAGADYLIGGDLSCLLHLAGKARRQQRDDPHLRTLKLRHVVEVLAGDLETPPIGEKENGEKQKAASID